MRCRGIFVWETFEARRTLGGMRGHGRLMGRRQAILSCPLYEMHDVNSFLVARSCILQGPFDRLLPGFRRGRLSLRGRRNMVVVVVPSHGYQRHLQYAAYCSRVQAAWSWFHLLVRS